MVPDVGIPEAGEFGVQRRGRRARSGIGPANGGGGRILGVAELGDLRRHGGQDVLRIDLSHQLRRVGIEDAHGEGQAQVLLQSFDVQADLVLVEELRGGGRVRVAAWDHAQRDLAEVAAAQLGVRRQGAHQHGHRRRHRGHCRRRGRYGRCGGRQRGLATVDHLGDAGITARAEGARRLE